MRGFVFNYLRNLPAVALARQPSRPLLFSYYMTLTTYIDHLDQAIREGGVGNCQTGRLLMNIDTRGDVARCTETLDQPVGNILTDDIFEIRSRLHRVQREQACAQCWTSCRGFAESVTMRPRLRQFREFLHSVKRH